MKIPFFKSAMSIASLLLLCAQLSAQQMPSLPIDPKVRYGKLDNGLTYYIRHNEQPKQRAEFYIAQRVGSILEEEPQRGLAHFLEHMAFNGTKNFPAKTMLNYLETIGVKFGENVNAYTSFDETVYNLSNVPVIRETITDSCLLVLHDWSSFITLDNTEIDKERGVIHEEWRTRNNAGMRIWEKLIPEMFVNSQYANRMPIGLMDVVDKFKYQAIKDYYKKWYRPDLQAIIVVGDIDVDQVEGKIKKMFADIPKPVNAAERIYYPVPANAAPIVSIATDPEATQTSVDVFYKHDPLPDNYKPTVYGLIDNYMKQLAQMMLNSRLAELTQKATPPFVEASVSDDEFIVAQTKEAFSASATCKEGDIEKGMRALLDEVNRVAKFGFTATEYERAKADLLRSVESAYNDREKEKNRSYVREYVKHFTVGEVIPGIEMEYNIVNKVLPQLPLEELNKGMKEMIADSNVVIAISGPQKEGLVYPSKEEVAKIFMDAKSAELTAYQDKVSNEPLVSKEPKAGKVKKVEHNKTLDATIWTLSNGARVVIKKTDFKEDQIMLKAVSLGGSSLLDNKEMANILAFNEVIGVNGLGSYSNTDLPKALAGKKASVSASMTTTSEAINGSCSPKDLLSMMQLAYLSFTAPRPDKDAYEGYLKRAKAMLENDEMNPNVAFRDSLYKGLYGDNPRAMRMKVSLLPQVNYDRIQQIYKERFANAADFTFFFVGNVNADSLKPLVEKYIASLPAKGKKEKYADIKMNARPGMIKNYFDREMQTAKATVYTVYSGNCPYTLENVLKMNMLDQILEIIYTEKVREDEGGSYGVGVNGNVTNYPKDKFRLLIGFDTNEAQKDKLLSIVHSELKNLSENGPSEVNFNKVKEFMLKKQKENLTENGYWMGVLTDFYLEGNNFHSTYESVLNTLTPESIKAFAASLLSQGNNVEVMMNGIKK
ncbi:MAG: insulinase family protein [Bacteroidales bacterium]|nr:insulinase family protein [Bacteroidales bacterium]